MDRHYCAVKTPSLKAVFACHVKTPGDEPTFVLQLDGATYEAYGYDRRDEALREWRGLAGGTVTIDLLAVPSTPLAATNIGRPGAPLPGRRSIDRRSGPGMERQAQGVALATLTISNEAGP